MLIPTQKTDFLGLIIDSVHLTLTFTAEKLQKVHHLCWEVYKAPRVSILKLTQLISLLSSTAQAVLLAKIDFEAKLFVSANNTPGCHVQMRTKMVDTKSFKQTLL